ncbi:MAG: hypothetical protein HGA45_21540 [Chloroflexales bacterium]|nr:hypothetical protein [Chloroflexales bacterium]
MSLRANVSIEGDQAPDAISLLGLRNACSSACEAAGLGACDDAGSGLGQADFQLALDAERFADERDEALDRAVEAVFGVIDRVFAERGLPKPKRDADVTVSVFPEEPDDDEGDA